MVSCSWRSSPCCTRQTTFLLPTTTQESRTPPSEVKGSRESHPGTGLACTKRVHRLPCYACSIVQSLQSSELIALFQYSYCYILWHVFAVLKACQKGVPDRKSVMELRISCKQYTMGACSKRHCHQLQYNTGNLTSTRHANCVTVVASMKRPRLSHSLQCGVLAS